jgi:hypothetical protein
VSLSAARKGKLLMLSTETRFSPTEVKIDKVQ